MYFNVYIIGLFIVKMFKYMYARMRTIFFLALSIEISWKQFYLSKMSNPNIT